MLGPAAGDGALIAACPGVRWTGIEIDAQRATKLRGMQAIEVLEGDALCMPWPDANVISNPPFCLLDAFWCAAARHRAERKRWTALFCPVAWFSAEKRREYVRPDHILQLGWRPVFRREKTGPGHKGSQDFVWNILAPKPSRVTTWERMPRREELLSPEPGPAIPPTPAVGSRGARGQPLLPSGVRTRVPRLAPPSPAPLASGPPAAEFSLRSSRQPP